MAKKPTKDQKRAQRKKAEAKAQATRQHQNNFLAKRYAGFNQEFIEAALSGGVIDVRQFAAILNGGPAIERPSPSVVLAKFLASDFLTDIRNRTTQFASMHENAFELGVTALPMCGRVYMVDPIEGSLVVSSLPFILTISRQVDIVDLLTTEFANGEVEGALVYFVGVPMMRAIFNVAILLTSSGELQTYFVSGTGWHLVYDSDALLDRVNDAFVVNLKANSDIDSNIEALWQAQEILEPDHAPGSPFKPLPDQYIELIRLSGQNWAYEMDAIVDELHFDRARKEDELRSKVQQEYAGELDAKDHRISDLTNQIKHLEASVAKLARTSEVQSGVKATLPPPTPASLSLDQRLGVFF